MTKLIKIETLEYPVTLREFKQRHNNVSFPAQIPFAEFGYAVVFDTPKPATSRIEQAVEEDPNLTGLGTWEKVYTVVDITVGLDTEELAALTGTIQAERGRELMVLSDSHSNEDLTVDGFTFTTDNESVADITTALSVMGRNPNDSIDFRGKSGWALANKASLQGMQNAVWVRRKAVNANTKTHEDAITLLTTVQEVVDYDITTGW